jgi:hypothetical protein
MTTFDSDRTAVESEEIVPMGRKTLIVFGVVAGPLFLLVALAQGLLREGFDLVRLPLSLLSLGDLGWIQRTNFAVDGALALGCSAGFWRQLESGPGRTWGPILIGVYGAGLLAAGFFPPDAALGFPPGTPQGVPQLQTLHSQLHGFAFDIAFLSLIAACFVFARRFGADRRWGWAGYCAASGLATPVLVVLGFAVISKMGALFFGAGAVAMLWLSLISAAHLATGDKPLNS